MTMILLNIVICLFAVYLVACVIKNVVEAVLDWINE
jgi:hypothetical protein